MRGRGPVMMSARLQAIVAELPESERRPTKTSRHINEIWIKRGGPGKSGDNASGWKLRPSKVLARSLAEMARKYANRRAA